MCILYLVPKIKTKCGARHLQEFPPEIRRHSYLDHTNGAVVVQKDNHAHKLSVCGEPVVSYGHKNTNGTFNSECGDVTS